MAGKIYRVCRDWNPATGRRDGPWRCPCDGFKYRRTCSHLLGLPNAENLRHQYPIPADAYEPVGVGGNTATAVAVKMCVQCGDPMLPGDERYTRCVNCDLYDPNGGDWQ